MSSIKGFSGDKRLGEDQNYATVEKTRSGRGALTTSPKQLATISLAPLTVVSSKFERTKASIDGLGKVATTGVTLPFIFKYIKQAP